MIYVPTHIATSAASVPPTNYAMDGKRTSFSQFLLHYIAFKHNFVLFFIWNNKLKNTLICIMKQETLLDMTFLDKNDLVLKRLLKFSYIVAKTYPMSMNIYNKLLEYLKTVPNINLFINILKKIFVSISYYSLIKILFIVHKN